MGTALLVVMGLGAASEAYFAKLLGLRFVAVIPRGTAAEKVAQIEFQGGSCHFVDEPRAVAEISHRLAAECGGHFMDQFTYAERATDWRGNNNIAESMFTQMARERHPVPRWIVVGAGTGGTSATIGRFVRYQQHATQLCVADPQGSVFAAYHASGDAAITGAGSRIEGRVAQLKRLHQALLQRVYRALDCLPVAERVVWILRHIEGEQIDGVAQLAGCSLATAKRRLLAAHQAIERTFHDK